MDLNYQKTIKLIRCRYCGTTINRLPLVASVNDPTTALFSCQCDVYPMVQGILYLKRDLTKKNAISFLLQDNGTRGLRTLLNTRLLLFIPIYIFLGNSVLNNILLKLFHKELHNFISFERFVSFLALFFYDKSWCLYLVNRKTSPTYFLSVFFSNIVKSNKVVLDVGTGAGHLLQVISKKTSGSLIIGIDKSFLNLFFARKFHAATQTLLICADIDQGFPLKDRTVDTIFSIDSFDDVKNKSAFFHETKRVMTFNGKLCIVHILNKKENEKLLPYIHHKLKNTGFAHSLLPEATILKRLQTSSRVHFKHNGSLSKDSTHTSYCLIAAKSHIIKSISFAPDEYENTKSRLNISLDPRLYNEFVCETFLNTYNNYVFFSPHLDDAVLSCEELINNLTNKKVTIVSVFTKPSPPPYTTTALRLLKICGYKNAEQFFYERKKEDIRAVHHLSCNYRHLDFIDAAWRKSRYFTSNALLKSLSRFFPSLIHIYKNEKRQFGGALAWQDRDLIQKLLSTFKTIIPSNKRTLVFAPLGIGNHPDHYLVREAASRLNQPTFYWEDYPYNSYKYAATKFFSRHKDYKLIFELACDKNDSTAVNFYKTYKPQALDLFPEGIIPKHTERYYILHNHVISRTWENLIA